MIPAAAAIAAGTAVAEEILKRFKDPNLAAELQSKTELAELALDGKGIDAYIAEQSRPVAGKVDAFARGLSTLIRPLATIMAGVISILILTGAFFFPDRTAGALIVLGMVPLWLAGILGGIFTFWFGGRAIVKDFPAARAKVETAKAARTATEIAVATAKDREIATSVTKTEARVRAVEEEIKARERELAEEGTQTPADTATPATPPDLPSWMPPLLVPHDRGGVSWRMTRDGVSINGAPPSGTSGRPVTVGRIVDQYGDSIRRWSAHYRVPAELIVATIATESRGDPAAFRQESGGRYSVGLMQTLQTTAAETLRTEVTEMIDREWLSTPDNSIRAGTAYIARQFRLTGFDPPLVAAAYNAGTVREDTPSFGRNRWNLEAFDGGKDARKSLDGHVDRYIQWFNDCCRADADFGQQSFRAALA